MNEFEPEVEYDESEDEPEEDPYEFMDQDDGRNNPHRQHSVESRDERTRVFVFVLYVFALYVFACSRVRMYMCSCSFIPDCK